MTRPVECGFSKIGMPRVNYELMKFKNLMDDLGIEFFITAGVLLGLHRDLKLIEYDKDFDFGLFGEDAVQRIYDSPKIQEYYDEIHFSNTGIEVPNGKLLWLKKYIGEYVIPMELQVHYIKDDYVYYNRDMGKTWKFREGRLVWEKRLFEKWRQKNSKNQ